MTSFSGGANLHHRHPQDLTLFFIFYFVGKGRGEFQRQPVARLTFPVTVAVTQQTEDSVGGGGFSRSQALVSEPAEMTTKCVHRPPPLRPIASQTLGLHLLPPAPAPSLKGRFDACELMTMDVNSDSVLAVVLNTPGHFPFLGLRPLNT